MLYLTDYVFARLPPNVDNFILVLDLEGFGYQHCYYEQIKECITLMTKLIVSSNQKIVCANPNMITRMVWSTL